MSVNAAQRGNRVLSRAASTAGVPARTHVRLGMLGELLNL